MKASMSMCDSVWDFVSVYMFN